jgi:hypothetical protein
VASEDAKYQYQRAYNLTKDLRDQLYVYSNEQLKQLQAQSVLMCVVFCAFFLLDWILISNSANVLPRLRITSHSSRLLPLTPLSRRSTD